jgi:phosphoenolpyruvate carboxylase
MTEDLITIHRYSWAELNRWYANTVVQARDYRDALTRLVDQVSKVAHLIPDREARRDLNRHVREAETALRKLKERGI